jgi:hypothetical protein
MCEEQQQKWHQQLEEHHQGVVHFAQASGHPPEGTFRKEGVN